MLKTESLRKTLVMAKLPTRRKECAAPSGPSRADLDVRRKDLKKEIESLIYSVEYDDELVCELGKGQENPVCNTIVLACDEMTNLLGPDDYPDIFNGEMKQRYTQMERRISKLWSLINIDKAKRKEASRLRQDKKKFAKDFVDVQIKGNQPVDINDVGNQIGAYNILESTLDPKKREEKPKNDKETTSG